MHAACVWFGEVCSLLMHDQSDISPCHRVVLGCC